MKKTWNQKRDISVVQCDDVITNMGRRGKKWDYREWKKLNDTISIMETIPINTILQLLIFINKNVVILCINYTRKEMSATFGGIYFCMSDHCSKY